MRLPSTRSFAFWCVAAVLIGGCGSQLALVVLAVREWRREVAPFEAVGARVRASGGADMGRLSGRAGVQSISFYENVGDAELASLGPRMERFPNLDSIVLEGPGISDAGLAHLKGLRQLKTLNLLNTRATPEGIAELRGVLPGLSVP